MCNLYSLGRQGPDAVRAVFGVTYDETGNMPELPGIHPKTLAPVVLMQGSDRVLAMKSWGMPSPAFAPRAGRSIPA